MTAKSVKKESAKAGEAPQIKFKCRFCEAVKPYSEMVVMPRFFPPLTACQSCALKMEYAEEREQN
jgi:hypothetical protein